MTNEENKPMPLKKYLLEKAREEEAKSQTSEKNKHIPLKKYILEKVREEEAESQTSEAVAPSTSSGLRDSTIEPQKKKQKTKHTEGERKEGSIFTCLCKESCTLSKECKSHQKDNDEGRRREEEKRIKRKEYLRAYFQSERGKERKRAYKQSDKGKLTRKNYLQSEHGKARKIAYEQSEHGKLTRKAYKQSDKGKLTRKNYFQSEQGKARLKAYEQSEHGKLTRKKYLQSDKGKEVNKLKCKRYYIRQKIKKAEELNDQVLVEALKKELEALTKN